MTEKDLKQMLDIAEKMGRKNGALELLKKILEHMVAQKAAYVSKDTLRLFYDEIMKM